MAQDLRERAMQLREWLQEILPGENSDFEVTQETVEALERFRESRTKAVEKQIVEIHHLESKTVKAKEKTKKIESQYPILQVNKNIKHWLKGFQLYFLSRK